ncbi:MAG: glycosyltransferase [Pleurocapsa sp. MO_192.B19]|nr:glycosyltransferase [Pleurocapsa sp. MO_192.B19]
MNTINQILHNLELSELSWEHDNHLTKSLFSTKFPLISIVVPVYNGSKYIEAAIKSILNQTYSNYEIIVVDDGSTDDTRDKLKPYEDEICYLYQTNKGSASARNLGIKVAKGELIAFLDADDYWSMPEKLEKQVACFSENPNLGCVNTGWRIVNENNKHIKTVQPWHKAPELNLETWLRRKCVRTSAMIFRREWLEKVGGFDEELRQSHDVDLILRLSLAGCQTMWLKEGTVCYRQHDENTTKNSLRQAKYVQAVLDKFFARDDLPKSIRQMESQTRYHTLVWLAWYQYRAYALDETVRLLQKSLNYTPYLRVENIPHWLTSFARFSADRGEKIDIDFLTSSRQWQELITSILRLSNHQFQPEPNAHSKNPPENNSWEACLKLGETYQQIGDLEQAAIEYQRVIQLKPDLTQAYKNMGEVREQQGQVSQAISSYQKAVELGLDDFSMYEKLVKLLSSQQKWSEAIAIYCRLLEFQPDNKEVLEQLSYAIYQQAQSDSNH